MNQRGADASAPAEGAAGPPSADPHTPAPSRVREWRRPLADASRRWRPLLPVAVLAAALVVLFPKALLRGEVFYYRDLHFQWVVQMEALVRSVAAGSWPVWNPYVSFGQPLLANPNNQVFYPPTWLNLVMQPWRYYTLFVAGHFLLSGLGLYLLSRRLGASEGAALLGGVVWIASGPFVSLVSLWNHLAGAAWIPWAAWAADRTFASGRARDAAAWGCVMAAPVLAGSPEMGLIAGAASLVGLARPGTAGHWKRAGLMGALALAIALGVSAAQWVPTVEMVRRSLRSQFSAGQGSFWSIPPVGLVQCLFPLQLDPLPLRDVLRAALFESREPFLHSLYLGIPALGLAAAAVLRKGRLAAILTLLALGGIAVALGPHLGALGLLETLVPFLRSLRFPAKGMILTAFGCAVLASLGFDWWLRRDHPDRERIGVPRILVAVLAATAAGAALLARLGAATWGALVVAPEFTRRPFAEVLAPLSRDLAWAAAFGLILVLTTVRAPSIDLRLRAIVAAGAVAGDLLMAHRNLASTADSALLTYRPPALQYVRNSDHMRTYSYDYFEPGKAQRYLGHNGYLLKLSRRELWPVPWADAIALRTALYPSVIGFWGVEGAYALDGLGLYPRYLTALTWFIRAKEGTPVHLRLLRMGAVRDVVALHGEGFEDLQEVARLPGLFVEPIRILRVPRPLPRTYVVGGARVADEAPSLRLIEEPSFDPEREIILPEGTPVPAAPLPMGTSRIVEWKPDRVRLEADLVSPGYVVLVDTYDPSWRATVDGAPAEILRANVAFRAVRVPAGRHLVEMVCRPASLVVGLAVTALTVSGLLAGLVLRRPRAAAHPA
jgi:hypothetical protein